MEEIRWEDEEQMNIAVVETPRQDPEVQVEDEVEEQPLIEEDVRRQEFWGQEVSEEEVREQEVSEHEESRDKFSPSPILRRKCSTKKKVCLLFVCFPSNILFNIPPP